MEENIVFKCYEKRGKTFDSLKEEIENIKKQITKIKVYPSQIRILSYKGIKEELMDNNKDIKRLYQFFLLDKDSLTQFHISNRGFPLMPMSTVLKKGKENSTTKYIEELIDDTGIVIEITEKDAQTYYYGLSKYALIPLALRAGVSGERIRENNIFRDVNIASGITRPILKEETTSLEERNIDRALGEPIVFSLIKSKAQEKKEMKTAIGTGIILYTYSDKFVERNKDVIISIVNRLNSMKEFKKIDFKEWKNTQTSTEVFLELNELAEELKKENNIDNDIKIILNVKNSDSGIAPLYVKATIMLDNELKIETGSVVYKSNTQFVLSPFMQEIKKIIYKSIVDTIKNISKTINTKIPETNKKTYLDKAYKEVINTMPTAKKTLGVRRIRRLSTLIKQENNINTLYDIIKYILLFPINEEANKELGVISDATYNKWLEESKLAFVVNVKG